MTTEQAALHQKFTESRQKPLRLSIALENFSDETLDTETRDMYR